MSNTSHKRQNKNIQIIAIIVVLAALVVSYFVSQKSSEKPTAESIAGVEVMPLSSHVKGAEDAEFKLVEYSDFQCPACKNAAPAVSQLVADYGDRVSVEYRHYPLRSIHPNAQIAAQAAEAAGKQGKFWEMHDLLFEKQTEWATSFNPKRFFKTYAQDLGLHADRFAFDLEADEVKDLVNAQFNEAQSLSLPGTPAFVMNGEQINLGDFIAENLFVEELNAEVSAE